MSCRAQPATAAMGVMEVKVDALIWYDHIMMSELCAATGTGNPAIMVTIRKLGCRKVCTRLVLKILTIKHQNSPKKTSTQKCLQKSYKDRHIYLSRIITSDELWVHRYDPLMKRQSMKWHHHSTLHRKS